MVFEYVDNVADAGIRASGETLNEAFCEAARAMFNLMIDLDLVEPRRAVKISVYAKTVDLLLVEWLSRLLTEKDLTGLVFSQFSAQIEQRGEKIVLTGVARGEAFDALRHEAKTEVKGVTYAGLRVWQENGRFIAQCVVDV
ncbi:MAG TPA: archease [Candidatus Acetothermia bacterium]|nr:archease [Candidatus Acetothermia bacterium]